MVIVLSLTVAILVLLGLFAMARRREAGGGKAPNLQGLEVIDLKAFRNLMDPDERQFLQAQLSTQDYRRVQRLRLLAAAHYVRAISHNAARLVRIAESASRSSDPAVSNAGSNLLETALQVRKNAG